MPHRIYEQHVEFLWRAPSMRSWEKAYKAGELDSVQSVFWRPKPYEELYDCEADPHNIHNLAADPARSEEHTSELQSLMRISYAVFCLKKKNKISYKQK